MKVRLSGQQRKDLAAALVADIDTFCVSKYVEGHRSHLGASVIGEKCNRKLWYTFRWMYREQFTGQKLRLFNRGHREEERLIEWIRGIGAEVWSHAPDGKQMRISASGGHFGGSLDGALKLPTRYGLDTPFLAEFKTHNQKQFDQLIKNGVRISHPKHFDQMSTYGAVYDLDYACYFAICKNTDDIHVEVVEIDKSLGHRNLAKANDIILSQHAPGKIAASPAYKDCSYCSMKPICHLDAPVEVNCRSCQSAVPIDGGEWYCIFHNEKLSREMIEKACEEWSEIAHR